MCATPRESLSAVSWLCPALFVLRGCSLGLDPGAENRGEELPPTPEGHVLRRRNYSLFVHRDWVLFVSAAWFSFSWLTQAGCDFHHNHKDNRHAGGVTASLPGHCLWLASEEQTISLTVSLSLHLMGPAHSLGEGRRSGKLSWTAWNSFVQQLDFSSKLKNQEWKDTFFFLKSVCINSAIIF